METLLFVTRRTPPLAGIRQDGCLFSLFSACEGLALEKSGVLEHSLAQSRGAHTRCLQASWLLPAGAPFCRSGEVSDKCFKAVTDSGFRGLCFRETPSPHKGFFLMSFNFQML